MQKRLMMSGNTLTVILDNGNVYTQTDSTVENYHKALAAETEEEIQDLIQPELYAGRRKQQEEHKRILKVREGWESLQATGEFTIVDDSIYLKGIARSLPEVLISAFCECLADSDARQSFEALKNFWYWTCLNPRAEVADMLFEFLSNNYLRVNKDGFFYALRNVVKVSEEDGLVRAISEGWRKIKTRKKGPKNYDVYHNTETNEYVCLRESDPYPAGTTHKDYEVVGNLQELYENLPNLEQNRYTDNHTKTFDIRIGQRVSMAPEDCSWSTADCGEAGLHFTMSQISYVGCGNTSVIMLINPMKVVGIGAHKGRCYEYLPIATIPQGEADAFLRDGDFDALEMEGQYAAEELQGLEKKAREGFVTEAKKHSFNLPQVSSEEIKVIVKKLVTGINEEVENRISKIKTDDADEKPKVVRAEAATDWNDDEDDDFEDDDDDE